MPEHEAAYLVTLDAALLDMHISATESRQLVNVARAAALTPERILEIHREHLTMLAAEALSDDVVTDEERHDLEQAAACLGLTAADVDKALTVDAVTQPQTSGLLLQAGDRVVFTGELLRKRDEWVAEIRAAGLATGGVTISTRVVVAADPDSLSGKAAKARGYGIPVITESAFEKHFTRYRDHAPTVP